MEVEIGKKVSTNAPRKSIKISTPKVSQNGAQMTPKTIPNGIKIALNFRFVFVLFFFQFRFPVAWSFRGSAGVRDTSGTQVKQAKSRKVWIPCGSGANLATVHFGTLVRSYSKEQLLEIKLALSRNAKAKAFACKHSPRAVERTTHARLPPEEGAADLKAYATAANLLRCKDSKFLRFKDSKIPRLDRSSQSKILGFGDSNIPLFHVIFIHVQ